MNKGEISTLMKSRRFLPLFITQFTGALSDNFIRTAFAVLLTYAAFDLSDIMRNILITMSMGLFMMPFVFLSATGGKIADMYDKSKIIKIIRVFGIFITFIGVIGFYLHSPLILLLSIFLSGIASTIFGPVKFSILPDHLDKNELIIANGLIEAGTFIGILLGIIAGGMFISSDTLEFMPLALTMLTISLAGTAAAFCIPKTAIAAKNITLSSNIVTETLNCMEYAKKDNDTFLSILGISWFWLIGGVFMSQMPDFTKYALNGDPSVLIMLLTIFSFGTAVGSMFCDKLLKGRIDTQYVPISIMLMTFWVFMLWYSSLYFDSKASLSGIHYFLSSLKGIVACISVFFIAFFGGIYIVPLYAFMQVRAKRSYRSRIIAANNIYNALFIVIASCIAMALLAINVSVSTLIFILTIINFLTAIYICRILPDRMIKNIFQTFFKLLYRVEVSGLENYMKAGDRVLIVANHAAFLDPPLIGAFLPKPLVFAIDTFVAKSWWIRPFLTYLRAYPIDPTNAMATRTLIEQLKQDKHVVIFPEGRLTITGSLMKIYEGPGLVADKADAKILPIRIDGPQYTPFSRLYGKIGKKLFPKIKITILEPVKLNVDPALTGRKRRQVIGNVLYDIMSNMMFEGSKTNSTLFESLIAAKEEHGLQQIIADDVNHNKLTYSKILMGSFALGKKIKKQTAYGENIGLFLPNASGTVVTFFACLAVGRVPAMLNFSSGIKNIISCCEAAKLKTIYTSKQFVHKADFHDHIKQLEEHGINVIYLEDVRASIPAYEKVVAMIASIFPRKFYRLYNKTKKVDVNKPAVVLFTSGSEGKPKGVVLSHSNIQSNIRQAASRCDFNSSDKVFNALPMFHSFGLTGGFLMPILSGVHTYFYPSPLHYRIIPELIYSTNSTILFGTDTFLSGYAKYAHPYDFFSIRYIFAGAEKLREETKRTYMEKFGIRIFEGYGATEAAPIISVNTPMHYKPGTVGRFMPNMEYKLEPVEGIENGGRLLIKGPNIMLGYLRHDNPGVLEQPKHMLDGKLQKNWYDTGDIVSVDEDNYITILGRAKRFAKIGGEMISLSAVEEVINALSPEHQHAVLNRPDAVKGETLVLITTDNELKTSDIRAEMKRIGHTELWIPKVIKHVDTLPVLGSGKIDYVKLAEIL